MTHSAPVYRLIMVDLNGDNCGLPVGILWRIQFSGPLLVNRNWDLHHLHLVGHRVRSPERWAATRQNKTHWIGLMDFLNHWIGGFRKILQSVIQYNVPLKQFQELPSPNVNVWKGLFDGANQNIIILVLWAETERSLRGRPLKPETICSLHWHIIYWETWNHQYRCRIRKVWSWDGCGPLQYSPVRLI